FLCIFLHERISHIHMEKEETEITKRGEETINLPIIVRTSVAGAQCNEKSLMSCRLKLNCNSATLHYITSHCLTLCVRNVTVVIAMRSNCSLNAAKLAISSQNSFFLCNIAQSAHKRVT